MSLNKHRRQFTTILISFLVLYQINHELCPTSRFFAQAARKGGGKIGGGGGSGGGSTIKQTEESILILQMMHLYDYNYKNNGDDWPNEFTTC